MARQRRGGSTANRPRALVSSAKRVRLAGGTAAVKADIGLRDQWQGELWAYFDSTPEFKQAVLYTGSVASKVRLFPAARPPGDSNGEPIPVDDPEAKIDPLLAAAAVEELEALHSELGGQAEILRLINMNLEVAGEGFLVGRGPREAVVDQFTQVVTQEATPQRWTVHSISEIKVSSDGRTRVVEDGKGNGVPLDPDKGDSIIRIWLRHARWTNRADTAWRGNLTELRILQSLSNERLALSQANMTRGVFRVANGLLLAGPNPSPSGDATEDPLLTALQAAFTDPAENPDSAYVLDWVYVRGEKEDLHSDVFGPIDLTRKRDAELSADIEQSVERCARGANLPPEKVMGHQETTFANARQIDRDEFDDYHDPRLRAITDALAIGYLAPNLAAREEAFAPDQIARIIVDFDPEDLIGLPPSELSADQGIANDAISWEAWRHAKGFTDADAPDEYETMLRLALRRASVSAELALAILAPLADAADVELPTLAQALIPKTAPLETPGSVPQEEQGAAAQGQASISTDRLLMIAADLRRRALTAATDPPAVVALRSIAPPPRTASDVGRRLAAIDRTLFDRTHAAASAAMDRALERAGAKIRGNLNAANRALVASVPSRLVAAQLGPALVADATGDADLFDGAFDQFGDNYYDWTTAAQRRALAAAGTVVDVGPDRDTIEERQTQDASASRDWLIVALAAVAADRLFRPEADAVPGEGNPNLTAPASTIRTALARAGGSTTDAGNQPVGLVATGDTIMGALANGGATVGGYTWIYGGADRPFEPHEDLDGTEFIDYSDDALSNSDVFPPFPYYFPGDHYGCTCTVEPSVDGPQTELAAPDGDG